MFFKAIRYFFALVGLATLVGMAKLLGASLSPDSIGMILGVLMGVLAGLPLALLVLASNRRRAAPGSQAHYVADEDDSDIVDGDWRYI
ncbi:MAG TPA: hypothetical protein P5121_05170 [Caldilineaceae bacterium]|nr:hypothetical protein [Caldilineaceae bacterium]